MRARGGNSGWTNSTATKIDSYRPVSATADAFARQRERQPLPPPFLTTIIPTRFLVDIFSHYVHIRDATTGRVRVGSCLEWKRPGDSTCQERTDRNCILSDVLPGKIQLTAFTAFRNARPRGKKSRGISCEKCFSLPPYARLFDLRSLGLSIILTVGKRNVTQPGKIRRPCCYTAAALRNVTKRY